MSARKWATVKISREVYCSSTFNYSISLWLRSVDNRWLGLSYDGGYWIYLKSRDFREFTPPAYVVAMFTAKFAEMYKAELFTFYEYRKVGNELVKDDDPQSLRYHDEETWRWVVEGILGKETVR